MIFRQFTFAIFAMFLLVCGQSPAFASLPHEQTETTDPDPTSHIKIENAWARATPPHHENGVGYLTIINSGTEPDTLLSITTADICEKTEFHKTTIAHDVATMHPVETITIPAKSKVIFSPKNYHVMFVKLKAPLKPGTEIMATLTFEKAHNVPVVFKVKSMHHRHATKK